MATGGGCGHFLGLLHAYAKLCLYSIGQATASQVSVYLDLRVSTPASAREATVDARRQVVPFRVSTPASAREATYGICELESMERSFNPRLRAGGDVTVR